MDWRENNWSSPQVSRIDLTLPLGREGRGGTGDRGLELIDGKQPQASRIHRFIQEKQQLSEKRGLAQEMSEQGSKLNHY